jgi:hypothetical protein
MSSAADQESTVEQWKAVRGLLKEAIFVSLLLVLAKVTGTNKFIALFF